MIKFVSRLNLNGTRVDRENGIIKGVSLIAIGDARGHGKRCDLRTLETVRDCAKQYGDGLRIKFNPNTFNHGEGSLVGRVPPDTIRIEDGKTVGDLHVYKSLPEQTREYLYEMAEETPANIGLSIEFSGDDEEVDGQKFARCDQIFGATIVDLPAANPTGLFSEGEIISKNKDEDDNMTDEQIQKLTAGIVAGLTPLFKFQSGEGDGDGNGNGDDKDKKKGNGDGDADDNGGIAADKEEMAAAGVTTDDSAATVKQKIADYRKSQVPVGDPQKIKVSNMTAAQLSSLIQREHMQFFRKVGNRPAAVSQESDVKAATFEQLIQKHLPKARSRGHAIMLARRESPKAYNEFMASKHPIANAGRQKMMVQ